MKPFEKIEIQRHVEEIFQEHQTTLGFKTNSKIEFSSVKMILLAEGRENRYELYY